jgi:methyl-accepting chemotaxis protein
MHKNHWFIAILISIASIAGIFYFRDANTALSTGQMLVLGLAVLAWLGLLFLLGAPAVVVKSKSIQAPSAEVGSLSSSFAELLSTIRSEFNSQISATEAELKQVKTLMDDAIDGLVDSFISLEATTRVEQNIVMLLVSNEITDEKDELNPFRYRQVKTQQFLQETLKKINKMAESATQNQADYSILAKLRAETQQAADALQNSLGSISKSDANNALAQQVHDQIALFLASANSANKVCSKLEFSSKVLSDQSKEVAQNVGKVIDENKTNITMVADEISMVAAQITNDVQMAVKSLQFQDMTTQLIVQCGERQKIMQEMLNIINGISNKDSAIKSSVEEWQTKLTAAHKQIKQASSARMKRFNEDAGSVELF